MLFDAHYHALRGLRRYSRARHLRQHEDCRGQGWTRQAAPSQQTLPRHGRPLPLFEPEFCNPAAGWEKGQVEKAVLDARQGLWYDPPPFKSLQDLNVSGYEERCQALWQETAHPQLRNRSLAECLEEERAEMMPVPAAFDGFIEHSKRVSSTCLITFENNRYSVPASFANRVDQLAGLSRASGHRG
jgi:hypothetical protein